MIQKRQFIILIGAVVVLLAFFAWTRGGWPGTIGMENAPASAAAAGPKEDACHGRACGNFDLKEKPCGQGVPCGTLLGRADRAAIAIAGEPCDGGCKPVDPNLTPCNGPCGPADTNDEPCHGPCREMNLPGEPCQGGTCFPPVPPGLQGNRGGGSH
jgi:hypothetical protein